MQTLRVSALLLCWALLASLHVAVAQPPNFQNSSTPWVVFHTALNTLTTRSWPDCSWNLHQLTGNGQSTAFYQFGGQSATYSSGWTNVNWLGTFDFSTNPSFSYGLASTITPSVFNYNWTGQFVGYNPISRVAGMTAVMPNGVVVLMAGKCANNWQWQNDVIYSTTQGTSWSLAIAQAPWAVRSDASMAVAPMTQIMVFGGGENTAGYLNDVWMSSDGIGQTWTFQTNSGFPAFQQGAMTFLWDGPAASSGSSLTYSTLVLYNPTDNNIYHSTDIGKTWQLIASMSVQGENPQQTGRMISDVQNNLYMAGGAEIGSQVYYSTNKGVTWVQLSQSTFYPGLPIADPYTVNNFEYGCLAINYVPSSTAPAGYTKQLIEYGGYITAVQDINSYYGCQTPGAINSYTSIISEIVVQGETVNSIPPQFNNTGGGGGNNVNNVTMIFHDAANQLIYRAYSDWTWDVHAALTRNSSMRMWQLGGYTVAWAYIPTIDFAVGSWNSFTTFTPTYNSGIYPTPSGKVAAGVGLLSNGVMLLFGGKDTNTSEWTNDVYASTNNGVSFTLVTYTAPWIERSDMVVAVMPGTNTIVLGGGQGNPNSANYQDWWYSTDGQGLTWQAGAQTSPFGPFQDAAFIAMYDSSAVSSAYTQQYSTLVINPGIINPLNANGIWKSINAGQSWTFVRTAPWTMRIRGSFASDMENYLYMMGGMNSYFGDIWISSNWAVTWNFVPQVTSSSVWPNTFSFQNAAQNCMALQYSYNTASPNNYHKRLVLWGGPADPGVSLTSIQVSQQPAPSCVRTVPVNVVYAEVMFPSELSNPSFTDTLATSTTSSNTPSIAFNNPTSLLTYRSYASCAFDVHSLYNGVTPNSYALGGWDINGVALSSLDVISGNGVNSYTYMQPQWGQGLQAAAGRVSGLAAVLGNGVLLWGAGKEGTTQAYGNDVWYSTNQGLWFNLSISVAPWWPRSDMAAAPLPLSNCVVFVGGQGLTVATGNFQSGETFFNDVWSSCDGYGATWTQQAATAPFATAEQASIVALYDNTASSSASPTNTILFYTWADQFVRSSNNLGATWTTLLEAPWNQRMSRFVADTANNVYMPGGMNPNNNAGDSSSYDNGIGDVWFTSNKGQSWTRISQSTTVGYANPVTLSTSSYGCVSMAQSGSFPHRQLVVYSNWLEVYSATVNYRRANNRFGVGVSCICDSLTGIRGVYGDVVFPSEGSPSNLPSSSSSSSSSTSYSSGQTAGIAVGVGVGVALLCCLAGVFFFSASGNRGKAQEKDVSSPGPKHQQFREAEPSTGGSQAAVEMQDNTA